MKNLKVIILCILISGVAFVLCNTTPALAEENEKPFIKEIGILSGSAKGGLKEDKKYNFIPVALRLGLNLGNLTPKDMMELEVEPFVNFVKNTDKNTETGVNLLFKYGYFLTDRICPYAEAGAGVVYQEHYTVNIGSHLNFAPQAGAGLTYFIDKHLAVSAGYRYRHLSNAGIKEPNRGINSDMWLGGISWFF